MLAAVAVKGPAGAAPFGLPAHNQYNRRQPIIVTASGEFADERLSTNRNGV
jgi:hypothetical protein